MIITSFYVTYFNYRLAVIQSRKIYTLHRREDVMTIRQNSFIAGEMISRRQMLEMGMPIGNPNLPPFNRREMPFFIAPAVTAASVAIGTAATVGSMAAIGTAALATVGAIGTIAAVAGTAMSVVGMVTGDKGLMKIGAIVGLAGGVASLASGAVASLAAGGEFATGTAGIQSANAANAASASAQTSVALGQAGTAASNLAAVTPEGLANAAPLTNQTTMGLSGAASNSLSAVTPQSITMVGQGGTGLMGQVGSGLNAAGGNALNAIGASSASNLAGTAAASSGTFLDKFMSSLTPKDYVIGAWSALSGGASMMKQNMASANQQKQYEYEQAQRNQRIANLNSVPTLQSSLNPNIGLNASAGL
jgi:hypothetical protein